MVTKSDFNVIATVIRECVQTTYMQPPLEMRARQTAITMVAECLADKFAVQNPRFDRARFLAACDVA